MRHWTWADWLETNLLRSDWTFAQLDWAPKKGPATTRDWRTAVHTPSLPGLSMQPQNRYWHCAQNPANCLESATDHCKILSNSDTFYSNTDAGTLYVMHDFNFNQYQLLIKIEQIYAYIYMIEIRISPDESTYHFGGSTESRGARKCYTWNDSVLRIPRVPRPSRRRAPQHGACGQPGKMELWSRYFKEYYWGNMGILGDITYYNYINYYSWGISHIISNDD